MSSDVSASDTAPTETATDTIDAAGRRNRAIALAAQAPEIGFRTTAVDGFYQPTVTGFPDYSNNPGQLRSYELISQYLLTLDAIWPPNAPDPDKQDIVGSTSTLLNRAGTSSRTKSQALRENNLRMFRPVISKPYDTKSSSSYAS